MNQNRKKPSKSAQQYSDEEDSDDEDEEYSPELDKDEQNYDEDEDDLIQSLIDSDRSDEVDFSQMMISSASFPKNTKLATLRLSIKDWEKCLSSSQYQNAHKGFLKNFE